MQYRALPVYQKCVYNAKKDLKISCVTQNINILEIETQIYDYMNNGRFNKRLRLMWKYWMKLVLVSDEALDIGEFKIFDIKDKKAIELQIKKAA